MEAPVSVSLGVVQSLPAKLKRLLSPEADHGLHKKDKDKIRLLKDHLQELIDKYLMEPSEVEAPASTARCWVKEVRELSYDIDDFLDELIHGHHADLKNLRRRSRWVADKVSQFRARLKDAIQRHKIYNLDRCRKRPGSLASEERPLPPQHGLETACLVGTDSSMEKLGEWLTGDAERTLRVVSIVGLGGVGKTTLAKELYRRIDSQFECRAFARTSQKPDMRDLLSSILLQVRPERPPDASESCNLIDTIRAHLQHKKYFIIIDDLWATSTWDVVCRALPDDKCCSRVLITTEIHVVAQTCCGHNSEYILKMGPLRDDESRKLFFSRFPGDQSDSCEQSKVLLEIIRNCGGFPLATVTISSLLARQHSGIEQCNYIRRSLSTNLRTNPSMEGMKHVLDLCYNNLPDRLKACMLYFSTYKEEHVIWKDDLVNQWIAEGFICAEGGNSMEEVASTYLDELVIGGMVQPVDVNHNGVVLSCTVHYMILNLVRYKSIEENFVTAIDGSQSKIRLADKVRRLSLLFGDAGDAEPPANLRLSQVRSLVFYGFPKCFPSIVEFRHLRVLILHLWGDQDNINFDLTALCKLFGLKHLEMVCNVTLSLQTEMQGLRHLETLKIDSTVSEVPEDIVHLPGLLHLSLPGDTNLPNGIGRLATLRTLGCFDLTRNSADNVLSLGELTNVWDLRLTCSESQPDNLKKNMEHVVSALSKLRNLKRLTLLSAGSYNENTLEASVPSNEISYDLSNLSSPSTLLETLELMPRICILSVLPEWIGKLRLLSILKIEVMGVSGGDIEILQELPALAALSLYVPTAPAERIIFHREGFPVLMQFVFICSALCVAFEEGAMPNVRRLKVGFNANTTGKYNIADAGLENLTIVEVFSAKIGGAGADEFCRKVVESTLEEIFRQNMRPPTIDIQFVGWAFYGDKENSAASATQRIAVEESSEDIVSPFQDPAFSCADKGISTASTTNEVVEEGSTENIVSHLRLLDPAFSYGDKEISTTSTTKQIANEGFVEDVITHLQDSAFSYGDKEISTALTTQQTVEEGSTEDFVSQFQDPTFSCDDKGSSTMSAAHQVVEEGSAEDFVPQLRDRAFSYGDKEISKLSATQRTGAEGSTKGIVTLLPHHAGDQDDFRHRSHRTRSLSPPPTKEPDARLHLRPPPRGHSPIDPAADAVLLELGAMEKYVLVKDLGAGNFAKARLIMRHKETRELVSIKYIPRGNKINEDVFREIVNHRSLRHPNIIRFKEVVLTPTHLAVVTEYAAGGELFERVCEAGRFHEDEARYFFQQLVCGVSYCHAMQICHRDLKLENMLLDGSPAPRLKICDIGCSRSSVLHPRHKVTAGTPVYIAPEVLSRREFDGKRADIWSCGVTLYAMLVGAYPFEDPKDPKNFRKTISV
ncbi:hypothetical protein PAHAL_8G216700 [Panicum hallii]|uniref:Protein kinase domain-containing protein n=1 Tax=Panicum hallii TaxID=206008 RepID=A0A2T8I9S4_9POAL|nr:hypothetical protein PAHAL_8G216700 [Panicum hallii]